MKLLGIDFETGGEVVDDHDNNFLTEIGAVMWDTDLNSPVQIYSQLVKPERDIDPFVERYTHITTGMANKYGADPKMSIQTLLGLMETADYVVAHNGTNFDRPVLEAQNKKFDLGELPNVPWIDTKTDVEYPDTCLMNNLTYLSGFHGILPGGHRAIFDVMAMMQILERYDLDRVIRISESLTVEVIADVSFASREKAKEAKFGWDAERKKWFKKIKEILLTEELMDTWNFNFTVNEADRQGALL